MTSRAPLVAVGVAALVGVIAARYVIVPVAFIIISASVCYLLAWLAVHHTLSTWYLWFAIAFTFMVDARLNDQAGVPSHYFAKVQQSSFERLERLNLPQRELGCVAAMSIGYRGAMPGELTESYRASGMAHIMAVSGLHVGIVFLLINVLLRWMCLFVRRAHRFLPYMAIVMIWSYVALTGASPSAIRAGAMFTLAQIAISMSLNSSMLNVLFGAGVMIVAITPSNVFNVSFQMSFVALLSIILWFMPLYSRIKIRYRPLNWLLAGLILSVVATVALAPMVSYYFGRVSFASVLVMPIASLTAYAIIPLSMLWVVAPVPFMAPLLSKVLYWCANIQNGLTEWGASLGAIEFRVSLWETLLFYALYISITLLFVREKKELPLSL